MTQAASGSFEQNMGAQDNMRGFCRKARSRWSVYEIGAMVLGFVVFWPLGLLALFAKLKNGEMWTGAGSGEATWASWKKPSMGGWHSMAYG